MRHLLLDHYHAGEKPIKQIEAEADGAKAQNSGMKAVPLYPSLQAFCEAMWWAKHGKTMSAYREEEIICINANLTANGAKQHM